MSIIVLLLNLTIIAKLNLYKQQTGLIVVPGNNIDDGLLEAKHYT